MIKTYKVNKRSDASRRLGMLYGLTVLKEGRTCQVFDVAGKEVGRFDLLYFMSNFQIEDFKPEESVPQEEPPAPLLSDLVNQPAKRGRPRKEK